MTTITKERLLKIQHWRETYGAGSNVMLPAAEAEELARIALASLGAEPVLYSAEETLAYAKHGELHLTCLSEPMGDAVIPLYRHAPPAPVSVPDAMDDHGGVCCEVSYADGWNACRAAMLHGAKPVSQTYKSQHTQFEQVADLYEMQFDDGRTCAFHTDAQKAAQWLQACDGNMVQEYVKLERLQNALSGNSPVIPDGWISCSERMPDNDESKPIAIFTGKCLGQGMFVATYDDDGFFDYWEGMEIIGVTHWMPLPEPPQK
ncbi:DUF551 domain-containing protein [Salmonella enterica subsp. enterica serovar Kentucky]|nr:DUF551 domain-containing protein [Salmonella enterica subsp. enterica serovar Kentucky]EEN5525930.1 DUF551 domain-containing protein [Salmonella enterica subsp. enterica serovar Kentucky]EGC2585298.1 DUF551 domain-containing protein [Salmonella enterica subsp. enterica]EIX6179312.1 DUF551 domain-containing protein [Salmonella enterica subsp. enterica]